MHLFFNTSSCNTFSIDDYEERDTDEDDNSVFFTEDKYDDGGSFIGEYSDVKPSTRKYEERFVWDF